MHEALTLSLLQVQESFAQVTQYYKLKLLLYFICYFFH